MPGLPRPCMDPSQHFSILNSATATNEERQAAQSALLAIQKSPEAWPHLSQWLSTPDAQLQFFGAQTLLVRVNCDWQTLTEEQQIALKEQLEQLMAIAQLTRPARHKLEDVFVAVMRKAFVSGWWKDPIGDCVQRGALRILTAVPVNADPSDSETLKTAAYSWVHAVRSAIPAVLGLLERDDTLSEAWLECLKAWLASGSVSFSQCAPLLPRLSAAFVTNAEALREPLIEVLAMIASLPSKDESDEAAKARFFFPLCVGLAGWDISEDWDELARLPVAVAEACTSFLASTCHDPVLAQPMLHVLLRMTSLPGIAGAEDRIGPMLVSNFWYALAEDCDTSDALSDVHRTPILVQVFSALLPILLHKATMPEAATWAKLPRDLQQEFLTSRRDYFDLLPGCFRILQKSGHFFAILQDELRRGVGNGRVVETRLRALLAVGEEIDSWQLPGLQSLFGLVFAEQPQLTAEPYNARLAISIIGEYLPAMRGAMEVDAATMLIDQLHNPVTQDEAIKGLLNAADLTHCTEGLDDSLVCELDSSPPQRRVDGFLRQQDTIRKLLSTSQAPQVVSIRPRIFQLVAKLIADTSKRLEAFDELNGCIPDTDLEGLAAIWRTWTLNSEERRICTETDTGAEHLARFSGKLARLLELFNASDISLAAAKALTVGLMLLVRSDSSDHSTKDTLFESLTGRFFSQVDVWSCIVVRLLSLSDPEMHCVAAELLTCFVLGWRRGSPERSEALLLHSHIWVLRAPSHTDEELTERLLDAWIRYMQDCKTVRLPDFLPALARLLAWTGERIAAGATSVPFLRVLARLQCVLIVASSDSEQLRDHVILPQFRQLLDTLLGACMEGRIGRSGIEIVARVLFDMALSHPDVFRTALLEAVTAKSCDAVKRQQFLRSLGAAHTISRFKTVFVDFCLQARGISSS